jgi:Putative transposase
VRVLSRLFRRLFLEYLQASFEAGELAFFGSLAALAERIAFPRRLTELRRVEWVVYAKRPFAGPDALLAYLGRYTHRVAISNTRLIALADGRVSFRWRDYRHHNKSKVITLAADEFIRRFLLHALPDGFHRIRHYGFLANRHRADKLALCRRLLAAPAPAHTGDDKGCPRLPDGARDRCPCCGGQMEPIGPFPRSSPVSPSAWHDSS